MVVWTLGTKGGSTISAHIRNGCHEEYRRACVNRKDGWIVNETVASKRIKRYYHMEHIPDESLVNFTTLITTVRNPISRFLSAFAYGHPINCKITGTICSSLERQRFTCFPSISYLVKAAMGRAVLALDHVHLHPSFHNRRVREETAPINCTELARIAFGLDERWPVVNATHPWLKHMTMDYRQYYRSMPPDKELLVLRNEHLWDDWVKVNHILSSENDEYNNWPSVPNFQETKRNVSSQYPVRYSKDGLVVDRGWELHTQEEMSWLCLLLHDEIRTYLMIVNRAANLNEDDLLEAASDVDRLCG